MVAWMVLVQCTIEKHWRDAVFLVELWIVWIVVDLPYYGVRVHESDKTNSTLGAYSSTVTVIIFACPVDHF